MLLKIYEKLLEREIKKVPDHVVVISNRIGEGFLKFAGWCKKFGVKEITVCTHENVNGDFLRGFKVRMIDGNSEGSKDSRDDKGQVKEEMVLNVITGYTGHEEIVNIVRRLAQMVANGDLNPEDVDEKKIESFLTIKNPPDIIIKAGDEVPEFLIWQSIYSELYFADIDWENLRYVDFLRILREYQRRERRYGK